MPKSSLIMMPNVLDQANKLPKDIKSKLFRCLSLLSEDFRHPSLQCKKIKSNTQDVYECRIDKSYRLIYDLLNRSIRCWYVGDHDLAIKFGSNISYQQKTYVEDFNVQTCTQDMYNLFNYLKNNIDCVGIGYTLDELSKIFEE